MEISRESSRRQTTSGSGLPDATHSRVTLDPSVCTMSEELRLSTMRGGTANKFDCCYQRWEIQNSDICAIFVLFLNFEIWQFWPENFAVIDIGQLVSMLAGSDELTNHVEVAQPGLGPGGVDLAHVLPLVRPLHVPVIISFFLNFTDV